MEVLDAAVTWKRLKNARDTRAMTLVNLSIALGASGIVGALAIGVAEKSDVRVILSRYQNVVEVVVRLRQPKR